MQLETTNSPFTEKQTELLNEVLPTLNNHQKVWLNGFLAANQPGGGTAVQEAPETPAQEPAPPVEAVKRTLTILVASQTGNGQSFGEQAAEKLKAQHDVKLVSMEDFKPKQLKDVEDLLVIASTHGEGDPPDNALKLYDFIHSKRAPKLTDTRFSVLALGDSSYEFFCQTGKDFDQKLEELGAERLHPRVDCDVDYEDAAAEWLAGVEKAIQQQSGAPEAASPDSTPAEAPKEKPVYSKKNPFHAEILENINLNGRGSNKETRHLELDLEGSGLDYKPGDSLGIIPQNDPVLVDELLQLTGWNPEEHVVVDKEGKTLPLKEALTTVFEITKLSKPLLEKLAPLLEKDGLAAVTADKEKVKAFIEGRDLVDIVEEFGPFTADAAEVTGVLRKIPPRLYSIASSSAANPDEVHLTVGAVRYEAHGRERKGVCSVQCAERSESGAKLPVFIQPNPNFKLPEKEDTPIIMIGAGTGVAPYRSFLEEREERDASGKSWMFFGDQHFVTDFLYQTEFQSWVKDGVLTKMDVAFSRDGQEKVYVQHRILEQAEEVYRWLEEGAYVYICGDKQHMAKDVHEALVTVAQEQGGFGREEAEAYLKQLRDDKRYQRDVY
ncbi:assimilatory sulfite reductase (NADPH) flavoprotein subunit [Alkalicoccus urumqiensis]|uniref:assimilatory sulfite reductase (NADPH) n=1 Tax=Alkalicoccus urumqiensis TaxID=1548213 RepID=A0A2P6MIB2_ALKUR|nr:assimilatory sulfite reductase (NADPH) flavoprotein subunit [Alkalicoccus urumqiensis]PRO66022.1 assimilatory sulfite reductase (NADPH) flavoprotein subunit [Alkalicoccus urumqiensis]